MKKNVYKELVLTRILYSLFAAFGVFPFMLSGMIFDAPGSEQKISNWLFFLFFPSFWIVGTTCLILAKVFYSKEKLKTARWVNMIPMLWILAAFLFGFYYGRNL